MRVLIKIIGGFVAFVVVLLAVYLAVPFFMFPAEDVPADLPVHTAVYDARYADEIEVAREHLAAINESVIAPSVSVAIGVGGEIVWAETTGYADLETETPADENTRYLIGSVSKPLTATVAVMLSEAGRIDLDARVGDVLPDFPAHGADITLRQLLSHRGGIRHYKMLYEPPFSELLYTTHFESVADSLVLFQDDPLQFEPGTGFGYSTFGYTLASRMMEEMAGQDFLSLMDETLFDPAGLSSMEADDRTVDHPARATHYSSELYLPLHANLSRFYLGERGVTWSEFFDASYKWAGGGFLATPTDLVRFAMALNNEELVSAGGRAMMFTPAPLDGVDDPYYGLGWYVLNWQSRTRPDGTHYDARFHGGTSVGSQCMLIVIVEEDITIAACMNAYTGGSSDIISDVLYMSEGFLDRMEAGE